MSQEPLILSIDTATPERSVAVVRGSRVVVLHAADPKNTGTSSILADIDAALASAGVRVGDVELFAAASGPGSFTGLRAGLATVKAFGDTLRRPVVGVPTLHAIAHAARPCENIIAFAPAGRGEIFAQTLSVNEDGEVTELERPAHVAPAVLAERAARTGVAVRWAGVGGEELFETLRAEAARLDVELREELGGGGARDAAGWTFAPPVGKLAARVAALALRKFEAGEARDAAELRALYVRASDAELNERCAAPK